MPELARRLRLVGILLSAAAGTLSAQDRAPVPAVNRAYLDTTCAPCNDFFGYVNGGWYKRTEIPARYTMTGMDLIVECRRLRPGQKIILVSGTVGEEVYHETSVRPDYFLAKPYEIRELTELVSDILAK